MSFGRTACRVSKVQTPNARSLLYSCLVTRSRKERKDMAILHSLEKLSSVNEPFDSCEDDVSGDEGGVAKTGMSLRAAEILL